MEKTNINQKITDIIVDKLAVNPSQVIPTANLANDLGADSLDTVELIIEFENAFQITIPEDEAENIKTVEHITAYIEKRLANEKK